VKTLLKLIVGVVLLRWLAGELAAYAGRHWRPPGPAPIDLAPSGESERANPSTL
jgi:hypothetical protein